MRAFSLTSSGLACLAMLVVGCDKVPEVLQPEKEPAFEVADFPFQREIRDASGRPLAGSIVGKADEDIFVIRSSDEMNFQIPIASLAEEDRDFAKSLPEKLPPVDFKHGETTAQLPEGTKRAVRDEPLYIRNRREAIERLENQNKILQSEASSTTNSMLLKSRRSQIDRNLQEITDLKGAIERYRLDN